MIRWYVEKVGKDITAGRAFDNFGLLFCFSLALWLGSSVLNIQPTFGSMVWMALVWLALDLGVVYLKKLYAERDRKQRLEELDW